MNGVVLTEQEKIENMIYEVREKQIMLDSDLAKLYQVETKRINEAVRRNPEKFPERFCFKLTDEKSNPIETRVANIKILEYLLSKV